VSNDWAAPTDRETVCRCAAGRRRYNAARSLRRLVRRYKVVRLMRQYIGTGRSFQARIARQLAVSPATICRDVRSIHDDWRRDHLCPACGTLVLPSWVYLDAENDLLDDADGQGGEEGDANDSL
jgi:hypothetical protein